jgi:chromosome segregation ATPase
LTTSPDHLTPELAELEDAVSQRDLARSQLMEAERLLAAVPELEAALDDAIGRVNRMSAERDGIIAESVRARAERERAEAELGRAAAEVAELRAELERMLTVMESVWRSPSWRITAPLRAVKRIAKRPSGR